MAVSYSYVINRLLHVDAQAATACMTVVVNRSHPVLEFLNSEWALYQRLVVILSHQNNNLKKKNRKSWSIGVVVVDSVALFL